jgi:flagellar hook assembly protein FlgD
VRFALDETARAQLSVYDVMGRKVATLVDAPVPAGEHTVRWNGRAADGSTVASGVYLLRLQAGERVATRRLTVVR